MGTMGRLVLTGPRERGISCLVAVAVALALAMACDGCPVPRPRIHALVDLSPPAPIAQQPLCSIDYGGPSNSNVVFGFFARAFVVVVVDTSTPGEPYSLDVSVLVPSPDHNLSSVEVATVTATTVGALGLERQHAWAYCLDPSAGVLISSQAVSAAYTITAGPLSGPDEGTAVPVFNTFSDFSSFSAPVGRIRHGLLHVEVSQTFDVVLRDIDGIHPPLALTSVGYMASGTSVPQALVLRSGEVLGLWFLRGDNGRELLVWEDVLGTAKLTAFPIPSTIDDPPSRAVSPEPYVAAELQDGSVVFTFLQVSSIAQAYTIQRSATGQWLPPLLDHSFITSSQDLPATSDSPFTLSNVVHDTDGRAVWYFSQAGSQELHEVNEDVNRSGSDVWIWDRPVLIPENGYPQSTNPVPWYSARATLGKRPRAVAMSSGHIGLTFLGNMPALSRTGSDIPAFAVRNDSQVPASPDVGAEFSQPIRLTTQDTFDSDPSPAYLAAKGELKPPPADAGSAPTPPDECALEKYYCALDIACLGVETEVENNASEAYGIWTVVEGDANFLGTVDPDKTLSPFKKGHFYELEGY